jgi:N-acetylmuramoyl-L-alanine amidase
MSEQPKPDSPAAAKVFPSPNHGERLGGKRPDMLLLHYTGMPDTGAALQKLCNPMSEVSAHYFVFENGHVLQLVPEARRAWHAGIAWWQHEDDINSRSIGIEIANTGHAPDGTMPDYPDVQIGALIVLCRDIVARWRIPADRVLGHSDVAPQRKIDPGETFPWERLHDAGVGHYVRPAPIADGLRLCPGADGQPVEALQAMLALYGYDTVIDGRYDGRTEAVVRAFQRHFRPQRIDGVADASTVTTLRDLIASRPDFAVA